MRPNLYKPILALSLVAALIIGLSGAAQAQELTVAFAPTKPVYKVGEQVEFKVRGNQNFYLYLFSIDKQRNRGVLLIPNRVQRDNRFAGGQTHLLPQAGINIIPDRMGAERVIMLAATRPLTLPTGKFVSKGGFSTCGAQELEDTAKALTLQAAQNQRVIQETTLVIISK